MKIILNQEDKDIYSIVERLLRIKKTNLTKVCEKSKRDYTTTYRKLNADNVNVNYLRELIKDIDVKASLSVELTLSLVTDKKEIINQKVK